MKDILLSKNKILEDINAIDYTHLLGYPSKVVAIEIITMVKDVILEEANAQGGLYDKKKQQ